MFGWELKIHYIIISLPPINRNHIKPFFKRQFGIYKFCVLCFFIDFVTLFDVRCIIYKKLLGKVIKVT
jgi:hypothetical protein